MENEYTKKLQGIVKGRVMIFIDVANLEQSVKGMFVRPDDVPDHLSHLSTDALRWYIDYKKLKEFFMSVGILKNIYFYTAQFNNKGHHNFRYFLDKCLKFRVISKPLKEYKDHTVDTPHRKANFDVEIATDSVFFMNEYETMILFSGDCDFEYLITFLRGHGKRIIGFSRSGHVAKELPPALSNYFDIANFRSIFMKIDKKQRTLGKT